MCNTKQNVGRCIKKPKEYKRTDAEETYSLFLTLTRFSLSPTDLMGFHSYSHRRQWRWSDELLWKRKRMSFCLDLKEIIRREFSFRLHVLQWLPALEFVLAILSLISYRNTCFNLILVAHSSEIAIETQTHPYPSAEVQNQFSLVTKNVNFIDSMQKKMLPLHH